MPPEARAERQRTVRQRADTAVLVTLPALRGTLAASEARWVRAALDEVCRGTETRDRLEQFRKTDSTPHRGHIGSETARQPVSPACDVMSAVVTYIMVCGTTFGPGLIHSVAKFKHLVSEVREKEKKRPVFSRVGFRWIWIPCRPSNQSASRIPLARRYCLSTLFPFTHQSPYFLCKGAAPVVPVSRHPAPYPLPRRAPQLLPDGKGPSGDGGDSGGGDTIQSVLVPRVAARQHAGIVIRVDSPVFVRFFSVSYLLGQGGGGDSHNIA